ncbi:helix-turn-helix domain-containing protein [Saccharopolyspora shandongensis]|nr:helix-turn-helix transcriptional regulator [Saccharopolyspora shandongensis]
MSGTMQCLAARSFLGKAVRNARIRVAVSQDQLAKKCGWSQGKIQKIESASQATAVGDVDTLVEALGIGEELAEKMRDSARKSRELRSGRPSPPPYFHRFLESEPHATEVRAWHCERIPGLLQSEQYMLAQFRHAGADDVTQSMRQRLERRKTLLGSRPPFYRVVLSESAFRRMPGGRARRNAILADQAEHLIEFTSQCTRLQLQVLPFDAETPYVPGDFTAMSFAVDPLSADAEAPEAGRESFVYLEHAHHGDYRKKSQELKGYHNTWDQLSAAALSQQDTKLFLQDLAEECRSRLPLTALPQESKDLLK